MCSTMEGEGGFSEAWYSSILDLLRTGTFPEDPPVANKIQRQSLRYPLLDGVLYRRSFQGSLLKCVTQEEGLMAVKEVREGMWRSHINGKALTQKILRLGDFRPLVAKDARDHVWRCDSCQRDAIIPHQPLQEMVSMLCPIAVYQWGVDIVVDLPRMSGSKKYAIVVVDYFTKWVAAKPIPWQDQE
ncbi:hypothetical protein LIER_17900 [Lithospermum erythrorhizon]|uniref:Integrase catalytic domain-containing protein n=1 Tax=Lithospermum erythrorhizon TaxID=34254 RepID=A0AAV3QGH0_LITER